MNYEDMTLKEFARRLGSGDAVPGGGGASALAGSLGAALGNMVAHLTVGRKRYADVSEEMKKVIRVEEKLQRELLDLITKDARMFEPLSRAYSMPKGTQKEQKERDLVMEEALHRACLVPLRIMELMCRALRLTKIVADKGNLAAVSDAGDAAELCRASLRSAALNVFINTKMMKNRALAEELDRRAGRMLREYVPLAERIYNQVLEQLRS